MYTQFVSFSAYRKPISIDHAMILIDWYVLEGLGASSQTKCWKLCSK